MGILDELRAAGVTDEAIERICDCWGGQPLYVPTRLAPDHPIAGMLGTRAARILVELYGGNTITVPMGAARRRHHRDRAIVQMADAGLSTAAIARRVGLHARHVRRILARARARS